MLGQPGAIFLRECSHNLILQ